MPDYKEMYLRMVRASEQALRHTEEAARLLIEAQRQCEELYLAEEPPALFLRRGEGKEDGAGLDKRRRE